MVSVNLDVIFVVAQEARCDEISMLINRKFAPVFKRDKEHGIVSFFSSPTQCRVDTFNPYISQEHLARNDEDIHHSPDVIFVAPSVRLCYMTSDTPHVGR